MGALATRIGLLVLLLCTAAVAPASAATVVSLTFDDGLGSQMEARPLLAARGVHATFYVNSGKIGRGPHLTAAQISQLAADGNEIGGHTVSHSRLTTLSEAEQRREVCDDRAALQALGYTVDNFAYPFGAFDATSERIVAECGYRTARTTTVPDGYAESLPPARPYATRAFQLGQSTTLAALQGVVTDAEQHGGGWVQLVFHDVCDGCDEYGVPASRIQAFLDWLAPRAASGTVVRSVREALGMPAPPPPPPPPAGSNLLPNPSLESDANGDGLPDCWELRGYGANTASWSRVSDAHSGSWAQRVDVTSFTDGDQKLVVRHDTGTCTPSVTAGRAYRTRAWYRSSAPVRFVVYSRDAAGTWRRWQESPAFPASSTWTEAIWTTPAFPAGAVGASMGLAIEGTGFLVVDDESLSDPASTPPPGDTTAPAVAVTAPADNATVRTSQNVTIRATASDTVGVVRVRFRVNGTLVGTDTTAPYSVTWRPGLANLGRRTITAEATDAAGNTGTSAPVRVTVRL